jgi:hypothetical protein
LVKDLMDRGGIGFLYRLVVTPAEDSFQLSTSDQPVAIPRGGVALIPVTVARSGYAGSVAIDVRGLPLNCGVSSVPGIVPAGQNTGVVALKADADTPLQFLEAQVVGKGDKGQLVIASSTVVFAQQTMTTPGFGMGGTIPSYSRPFVSFAAAVTTPGPLLATPMTEKLVVPQGGSVEIPFQVVPSVKGKKTFKLVALSPPTGLSVAESRIAEGVSNVRVKVTAASDAPLGVVKMGIVALDPAGSADASTASSTVAAALITLEVVRPAKPK